MKSLNLSNYLTVYDGRFSPNIFSYTVSDLETGSTYNFIVDAVIINGISPDSPSLSVVKCGHAIGLNPPI